MTGRVRPSGPVVVPTAAVLHGYAAFKFAQWLAPQVARADVAPEWREQLEDGLLALQSAGADWHAGSVVRTERARLAAEAAEAAEGPRGAGAARSAQQMTAAEVAAVLEVSTRRVGQIARSLGGRKGRGGHWVFTRAEVLAYVEGRSA